MDASNSTLPLILDDGVDAHTCSLLGPVSFATQGVMGVVVLLTLMLKRYRERPRRKWRIWALDGSKQCLGQLLIHTINLFSSDLISAAETLNACSLYLMHVLIDTTAGVVFVAACIRLSQHILVERHGLVDYASGNYGDDPNHPQLVAFGKQLGVYLAALLLMKALVLLIFGIFPAIFAVGDWLLSWLTWSPDAQVLFVVAFFPAIMTALQFFIIDSIIMQKPDRAGIFVDEDPAAEDRQHLLYQEGAAQPVSPSVRRQDYPPGGA